MYTYLLIDFFSVLVPVLFSFEKRVRFFSKWKYVFGAASITGLLFLIWDYFFTVSGVWGFNAEYLTGIYFFHLPIEEIIFFIFIPFSCIFIYEVIKYFHKKSIPDLLSFRLTSVLAVFCFIIAIFNTDKVYTFLNFSFLFLLLLIALLIKPYWLGYFYEMYAVSLIPFLAVNGLLTNGLKVVDEGPVVWYNPQDILGLRFLNIPAEDFFYSFMLLAVNVGLYEYLKRKNKLRRKSI
ncbi:MAG: lycopene cyclase domain-containing protein [Candidatus Omnitrophica bacterium]|nr:lycopene cyclase domain-containing protein [Candidatus Omnitrophota bacterium]MBD3268844.1 lycopene cyclase domain-containing protein [Candidatus Omnitrophota bacterium]